MALLGVQQGGEVVERKSDVRMVFAEGLLVSSERAFVEWLRLIVMALILQQQGEVVERGSDARIVLAEDLRANLERAFKEVASRHRTTPPA